MKIRLFLTAAAAALSSSTALAEEAGAWVNELVVTANRGVTVSTAGSATRTATPIEEIPQSIQAINRTLIEDQDLRTVGDALVNVSGVAPQGQMELVLQAPKIRGFDTAYLIDGLPAYNLPASASDPGSLINVARVEVAKGPTSTLYGGGTGAPLSGLVNLVSMDPAASAGASLAIRAGSFNTLGVQGSVDAPLGDGRVRLRLAGDHETADSFLSAVNSTRYSVFPTAIIDLTDRTRLTVRGQYSRVEQLEYAGLPVGLTGGGGGGVDRYGFAGAPDAPQTWVENRMATATLSHAISDTWTADLSVRRFENRFREYGSFPFTGAPAFGTTYAFASAYLPSEVEQTTVSATVRGRLEGGGLIHDLLAGIDRDETRYDAALGFGLIGFVDYANPATNLSFGAPPALSDIQSDRMTSTAVFIQDQVAVGERLNITAGLRWTQVDIRSRYESGGIAFVDSRDKEDRWTPRIGATYRVTPWVSAFAGYSEGFRGLVAAFGVTDPKPETSRSYEAGLKLAAPIPGLTGTLAAYQILRRNVVTADPSNPFSSIQSGEQRARGFEADLVYEPGASLSVLGAYAYTDAEVTRDNRLPVGDRPTRTPEHSLRLAARYRFQSEALKGLEIGGGLTAVSDRELTLPNTTAADGSVLLDAQAAWDLGVAKLSVSVVNLADEAGFAPYPYLARAVVAPLQPRSAYLTLSRSF